MNVRLTYTVVDLTMVQKYLLIRFILKDSSNSVNRMGKSGKASFQCTRGMILSFDIDGRLNMSLIVSVKLYSAELLPV